VHPSRLSKLITGTTSSGRRSDSSRSPFHRFPVALRPRMLEDCIKRLPELLAPYGEHFRRRGRSPIPPTCWAFFRATRSSVLRAAHARPDVTSDLLDQDAEDELAAARTVEFLKAAEEAIDATRKGTDGAIQATVHALRLLTRLVDGIAWPYLSTNDVLANATLLVWHAGRIDAVLKSWNDARRQKLARRADHAGREPKRSTDGRDDSSAR